MNLNFSVLSDELLDNGCAIEKFKGPMGVKISNARPAALLIEPVSSKLSL